MTGLLGVSEPIVLKGPAWIALALTLVACGSGAPPGGLPGRRRAPVGHGLEARYSDRIDFVYLDIDDPRSAPFKSRLGYLVQPHIFMLDGQGGILQQWVGGGG